VARAAAAAALASVLLLTACIPPSAVEGDPAPTPASSRDTDDYSVVIVGDSLSVVPPRHCDDCTTWVEQFADTLEIRTGERVTVTNEAAAGATLNGTREEVRGDVIDDLAAADLVLVWIGTNDGPPWPDGSPCGPADTDSVDGMLEGIEGYSAECMSTTIAEYGDDYEDLFRAVAWASPDAAHLALTTYIEWYGSPTLDAATIAPARVDAVVQKVASTFDHWNAEQCAAADATGFACVDTYHLINGPDGRTPGGALLADDASHLSQAGHDAVARLLASVDLDPAR
jgi:lysophospholipase L1-like esterase